MILPAIMHRPVRLIEQLARPLHPLLAALFEDSGTGVLVLDRAGRIVRTNRRLEAMLAACRAISAAGEGAVATGRPGGASASLPPSTGAIPAASGPAPDLSAEMLFAPADRQHVTAGFAAALQGDLPPPLQARLCAGNPASAPVVALSTAPLHESDGEISGLLLRLTDISVEKRLEAELAQLQKLQAVGQLAGGIAHDFNNLLTAIGAAADSVLERESCEAATLDDVRQIRQSADRGAALVRQLLAFGRRQPLLPVIVTVNAAVRNLSGMLIRLLGEHTRLRLELEEPGRLVRVDPTQLDRVLINLAVNANDAMPAGGTLTLRTGHLTLYGPRQVGSETMPPGRYVAISVEDTGEGIPPSVLSRVFEPFFTTRRDHGGSGLGLSTVYGIVRQSGGFVTVESAVGQGTCARVWLPRDDETEALSVARPALALPVPVPQAVILPAAVTRVDTSVPPGLAPAVPAEHAPPARRILLVEDEEAVRRLTERALQRAGWQVSAVESAEAAMEMLLRRGDSTGPPSVLVSDIVLPGMDGTELVQEVRAIWPDLPAVLVSGYTDSALLGDLTARGVSFLAKPFRLGDLVACVERAMASSRMA
jgi:two-component system, cell cycle sensor histidine kinase and response regulator CckA